jgi:hypothetical protein
MGSLRDLKKQEIIGIVRKPEIGPCIDCIFLDPYGFPDVSDEAGNCRRYPPVTLSYGGIASYPIVLSDYSCGEFVKKAE